MSVEKTKKWAYHLQSVGDKTTKFPCKKRYRQNVISAFDGKYNILALE
jgi:hypothetical protein